MCIERCKHGFGRGLRRPTIEMWQGGAFLLYPGDGDHNRKVQSEEDQQRSPPPAQLSGFQEEQGRQEKDRDGEQVDAEREDIKHRDPSSFQIVSLIIAEKR